jgi:hypothetical protein
MGYNQITMIRDWYSFGHLEGVILPCPEIPDRKRTRNTILFQSGILYRED